MLQSWPAGCSLLAYWVETVPMNLQVNQKQCTNNLAAKPIEKRDTTAATSNLKINAMTESKSLHKTQDDDTCVYTISTQRKNICFQLK